MIPVSRSATRGLWPALPLLFLSSVVPAQSDSSLEFDSAVDSHRRSNDDSGPLPPRAEADDAVERDDPRVDSEGVAEIAAQETGATPAGDMPAPVAPAQAMAPDEDAGEPESAMPKTILPYDSVLEDYAPYEEADGPKWIEANERVGEVGGWREYAKELYEPAPAAADSGDAR